MNKVRKYSFFIFLCLLYNLEAADANATIKTNSFNTGCSYTDDAAQQGAFSSGYRANFETLAGGNRVKVSFELLDTDKSDLVAYLWRESPFSEFNMSHEGDNIFSITIDNLTEGQTLTYACKFAFAGGLAVTQYYDYTVGENCNIDPNQDARLSEIRINNQPLPNFASSQLEYKFETASAEIPSVSATTVESDATVSIQNATDVPGICILTTTAADGNTSLTYSISFQRKQNFRLVWSDEFDSDGPVNSEKWHHQTIPIINGVNWANNEQQHYTNRTTNSQIIDSSLMITAKYEPGYEQNGVAKNYTSARLNSKFAFTYGRVDVRAKLPAQLGTWPAIWTLGKNISERGAYWQTQGFGTTPWPTTGEIDIMEQFGRMVAEKDEVHGSTHTPRSFGATENTARTALPSSTSDFHVYSIIWNEEEIQFLIDEEEFYTYNPTEKYGAKITDPTRSDMNWPFDEPQYLILNVAMGGVLGGNIPQSFYEATMEVDYVRVYQKAAELAIKDTSFIIDSAFEDGFMLGVLETDYTGSSPLSYTIIEGNEAGIFAINSLTGALTVEKADEINRDQRNLYTIQIEVSDGTLSSAASITIEITAEDDSSVLEVEEAEGEIFKVFPNPFHEKIRINTSGKNEIELIQVTDLLGKKIDIPIHQSGKEITLNFAKEKAGVYLLMLRQKRGTNFIRIVKY